MITLALLGMHPIAAFPIMMGSCALLMPVASLRFFESRRFGWSTSWGLTLGGFIGVLVAVYLVKPLPLETLRWLVTVVISMRPSRCCGRPCVHPPLWAGGSLIHQDRTAAAD